MERKLWPLLYQLLQETGQQFRQIYVHYQPWVITAVVLWAALHERPISWACQKRHWSTTKLSPTRLPSDSIISRRTQRLAFELFLNEFTQRLQGTELAGLIVIVDGKPLLVGGCSHDRQAR